MFVQWLALICTALNANAFSSEELLKRTIVGQNSSSPAITRDQRFNPFSSVKLQYRMRTGEVWDTDAFHYPETGLAARRTEVMLKFVTKGMFEAREYSHFTDALIRENEVANSYVKSVQLRMAYVLMAKAAREKEESDLIRGLEQLRDRSRRLGALQARISASDAKEVFKTGLSGDKLADLLLEFSARSAEVSARIKDLGLVGRLDTSTLLDPIDIGKRLDKVATGTLSADQLKAKIATDRAQLSYRYERERHLLDGIDLGISENEGEKILRAAVTFNLWFLAAKDVDHQRDRIRLQEAEAEASVKINEANERVTSLVRQLRDKVEFYQELSVDPLANAGSLRLRRADPALANEMEAFRLQRRVRILALSEEIRTLYVDLLFENRILSEQPRVNHLSKTKAVF